MPIAITADQLDQIAASRRADFKRKVIDHTFRKIDLSSDTRPADLASLADVIFEKVSAFLDPYPTATYESYVMMMVVYFIRGFDDVEGRDTQATLRNNRFGINTRVRVCYELAKIFLRRGL